MKTFPTIALLVALAAPVAAAADTRMCPTMGDLAESVMSSRQAGIAMSAMLDALPDDPLAANLIRTVVVAAFDQPRYFTESMQRRAEQDFRADIERLCYRGLGQ
jgi:hypothetical protein